MTDAMKPAGWPCRYKPIASPRMLAKKEPRIPTTVVRMKPILSLPGFRNLASRPIAKPIKMFASIVIMGFFSSFWAPFGFAGTLWN